MKGRGNVEWGGKWEGEGEKEGKGNVCMRVCGFLKGVTFKLYCKILNYSVKLHHQYF